MKPTTLLKLLAHLIRSAFSLLLIAVKSYCVITLMSFIPILMGMTTSSLVSTTIMTSVKENVLNYPRAKLTFS